MCRVVQLGMEAHHVQCKNASFPLELPHGAFASLLESSVDRDCQIDACGTRSLPFPPLLSWNDGQQFQEVLSVCVQSEGSSYTHCLARNPEFVHKGRGRGSFDILTLQHSSKHLVPNLHLTEYACSPCMIPNVQHIHELPFSVTCAIPAQGDEVLHCEYIPGVHHFTQR